MSKRRTNRIPRTKVKCEEYENLVQKQTNRNPIIKIKCQEYENLGTDGGTKSDEFSENFQRGGGIFNPKICIADFGPL